MEEWKTILVAPNYAVSNLGRVQRITRGKRTRPGLIRAPWTSCHGYQLVSLRVDGQLKAFSVHRLVMLAFVGESDLAVNHKNGNRTDNRLENLEYVTSQENQIHSRDVLGTMPKGEKHHNAKLTEDDVKRIFALRSTGLTTYQIGDLIGCTATNVQLILKRKAWAHVSVQPTLS